MDKNRSNPSVMALEWYYKVNRIENSFLALPDNRKYLVRYEDLIKNPVETTRPLCRYIGVEYEGERLDEEAGILATKSLLIEASKKLN